MVDLRKDTHGAGSTKGLNLAVIAYDKSVAKNKETGEIRSHYLDARLHPEDQRAAGQTTLALVTDKDPKSRSGYSNTRPYSASQMDAIKEAAGDNVAPLLTKDGEEVGKIYGVKADVLFNQGAAIVNTKTVESSDLSVGPVDGKDIQTRIFDSQAQARQARDAAKAAKAAEAQAAPQAETAAPEAQAAEQEQVAEPEMG